MLKTIIYSPLASLVLAVTSGSFFLTFISVRINIIDGSEITLGLIHSSFYCGLLIGAIKSEEIINRVGHIRAFSSFSSILTFTIILQGLYQVPKFWIFLRFFAGFSTAAVYVIIESWLLSQSTKKNKGKILSTYMACLYSAQTAGQFGLDIVDIDTIQPFLLAALIASISVIPASLTYVKAPEIEPLPKMTITKYFKASPLGFIGCMASGLMLSGIYGFLPGYALDNDLSVSILLGSTISGGFVLQLPIGKLSDTFDRIKIITLLALIMTLTCLVLIVIPMNNILIYIISFFIGGFSFTLYPVCIAQVCDHLENSNIINVTGVLLFTYGIGAVGGPPALAFLIKATSSTAIFYYIALSSFALFLFALYSIKTVESVTQEDQVDFVAVPRASPIASALDPRLDEEK
ncbi:MFS transporter [Rickettsiaceae bacterium]|nr:MFS transporter [Rickettsiaceae bacterium]